MRRSGPILIVAGSQHEATARQIEVLRESGVPIVRLAQSLIDDPAMGSMAPLPKSPRTSAQGDRWC